MEGEKKEEQEVGEKGGREKGKINKKI